MVSTPEGFTNSSTMAPNLYVYNKKPSAIKSLHKFTETLDIKHKTGICRFGASKEKCKSIKKGNAFW